MTAIKSPKKLIEVALPLDKINEASVREKSIRHGHPSTLHLWWARRPLAAARAVIFAQMVNDPGYQQGDGFRYGVNKEKAALERERLFGIIEDLVKWENTNNEEVLERARAEIRRSWRETCELNKNHPQAGELFNPEKLPGFHDPFAGGGALPLEAQRLGLESYASDLNPVAVTINKAMIEIPPKFAGRAPVGPAPDLRGKATQEMYDKAWTGSQGLAEDVRRYGAWMREEAQKTIGHLYPKVKITVDMAIERPDLKPLIGQELTVVAWLWARTVKSPNPAFSHAEVPLASTFVLSSKVGKEVYVEPVVSGDEYKFKVRNGSPTLSAKSGTNAGKRGGFYCLLSGSPIDYQYIRNAGMEGGLGTRLMAIVVNGPTGRLYLSPVKEQEEIAKTAIPEWRPELQLDGKSRVNVSNYGIDIYGDLFSSRQLVLLTSLVKLIDDAKQKCTNDAIASGMLDDHVGLALGGFGAKAYGEAVGVYLAFALDKVADRGSTIGRWDPTPTQSGVINTFSRQAIPMTWDFAESNPLGDASGNFVSATELVAKALLASCNGVPGFATQANAAKQSISVSKVVSTDPPYYDNIEYADLSDYFYVWMRRTLRSIYPELFATVAVPKSDELVATPHRHGGKAGAEIFFLDGMTQAMHSLAEQAHGAFPVTIYYAFKQSETKGEAGTHSTGWETFLEAVLRAGFALSGTWPMRTELGNRMISSGTNALASSIVLVCRKRPEAAPTVSRREFIRELNARLPEALADMTRGGVNSPVAPVDLSQAIIGPGMEVFSQYSAVLEADGSHMSVRSALQLINRFFAEDDFDHDTQFCLAWFDHRGWSAGVYGDAEVLARAKGTSVGGLAESGVLTSGGGEVRLMRWADLSADWSPETDARTPVWEALHQLIRTLNQQGESLAGILLARMPAMAEPMRALAYRLYTLCERKGWAEEARAYNELVTAWAGIEQAAQTAGPVGQQAALDI